MMKRKRSNDQSDDNQSDVDKSQNKERLLECEICFKQYKNKQTLKQHIQSHIREHKCYLCKKSFKRLQCLRIHQKNVHGIHIERKQKQTMFTCELCRKSFASKSNLVRHNSKIHQRSTPTQHKTLFSCRHCDCEFQHYVDLFNHVNENHPLNQHGGRRAVTAPTLSESFNNEDEKMFDNDYEQHDENVEALHLASDVSALRNAVRNKFIYPKKNDQYDVLTFFANTRDQVRTFLQSRLRKMGGIKWNLCVQVEMQRDDGHDAAITAPYFRSRTYRVLSIDDIHEHDLNEAMQKMYASLEKFMREGSGWYVRKALKLEIHTIVYKPVSGSAYIPLPKSLLRTHSLLNIQNQDDKCFLYCVLASLHPAETDPQCVEQYRQHENEINMSGITYPVTIPQIRKVENQNQNISINVFTYEDKSIIPLRITEHCHRLHHINLLWLTSEEKSHYYLITKLNRFLSRTKSHRSQLYFCSYCLHGFSKETSLLEHRQYCSRHEAQRVELPISGQNDILAFKDYEKILKVPFAIYADFETINRKLHTCASNPEHSATTPISKLEVCGFGYKVVSEDDLYTKPAVIYRGPDAGKRMIECLLREQKEIEEILSAIEPMHMTEEEHDMLIENASHCSICKKQYSAYDKTYNRIVIHHNHLTGKIIGPACNSCNLSCRQAKFTPVLFHNLKNFDAHILCENLGQFKSCRLKCIAQNSERYVSFSLGSLRFIDSFQFLPASLESLVENLAQDGLQAFPYLLSECKSEEDATLLLRKGVYPYDYMDSFDRFDEQELPQKELFYSTIKKQHISDEDFKHAKTVFRKFNMKSLGQYHDLYLKMDTVLLSQVFESFRMLCLKQYDLDPCHFYTSPGLSWSACLKMTGVHLELLTDIDKVLMVEAGIRGGVSQISNRYQKANNSYLPDYDRNKRTTFIQYLDANNLYGWAMIQPLPISDFVFMGEREIQTFDVMSVLEKGDTGYIMEVSLEYPESLHDNHNCLPLAPEKRAISNEELSPYAQYLLRKLYGISDDESLPNRGKVEKLLTTLENKDHYVVHYRNLQLYLQLGMKLKTIHRILKFKQEAWMKTYIDQNTNMRKSATSTFQKNFYKLMNVSVFGKTMENVRLHKDIELVHTESRLQKVAAKHTYKNTTIFNEDLVAMELHKAKVNLFKPIYCGMAILDMSKYLMYDFWYNYVKKKYKTTAQLQMTDTDSVLFSCDTEDIYEDMKSAIEHFDTSDYPNEHDLQSDRNKKVLGKMKDETNGKPISEFVGLRSKLYSFVCNNEEHKRAKGISKVTVKHDLKHEHYKKALFDETKVLSSMSSLRSHKHELFCEQIQKTGLSAFDDKRYLINAVESYAYGHYKIVKNENNNCDSANILKEIDQCDDRSIQEAVDQITYPIITVENVSNKSNVEWKTLDEQAFTLDDVNIIPCVEM